MKKFLIVANWKMAPETPARAKALFAGIKKVAVRLPDAQTVVCTPALYLSATGFAVSKNVALGAQDVSYEKDGAHTGEISARMLKSANILYVIIGHSERRARGETDDIIAKKVVSALKAKLTVILCVGEMERDPHGEFFSFIENQIRLSLAGVSKKDIERVIIAYEPVWAIGEKAKEADTPEGTLETALFIRKTLAARFGKEKALAMPILYGGSVRPNNANSFLARGGVQGLLVGRASLDVRTFAEILKSAVRRKT